MFKMLGFYKHPEIMYEKQYYKWDVLYEYPGKNIKKNVIKDNYRNL